MGDWSKGHQLLEFDHAFPFWCGKLWLCVLLFRVLLLGIALEAIWGDEQSAFTCNTLQPGCTNMCYDKSFPISHTRFWILQIICVSLPALCFLACVHYEKDERTDNMNETLLELVRDKKNENKLGHLLKEIKFIKKEHDIQEEHINNVEINFDLFKYYMGSITCKFLLEVACLIIQWFLYGFTLQAVYVCERFPCPHRVDCFLSRPTEKNIFIFFMGIVSVVALFITIAEFCTLVKKKD